MTTNREPDRFDRLPRRTGALLMALLMFAFSAGAFFAGLKDLHPGKPVVTAGGVGYFDDFFWSAAAFVLGACLLAVALGWKIPKRWLHPVCHRVLVTGFTGEPELVQELQLTSN